MNPQSNVVAMNPHGNVAMVNILYYIHNNNELILWHYVGLEVEKDCIIEMACIVTDGDLNTIAEV